MDCGGLLDPALPDRLQLRSGRAKIAVLIPFAQRAAGDCTTLAAEEVIVPRKPIVGGNWKMNTNRGSAASLASAVASAHQDDSGVEVIIFPPFPYLLEVGRAISGSAVMLGAQDVYHEADGAFTGEVSAAMLRDCGCRWVLTGHSERRHVIGEDDALVNRKTRAALEAGLSVILCIGETREQRAAGETDDVNTRQLTAGLQGVSASQSGRIAIAYEPVWAIGTGLTATPDDAQAAHAAIRATLAEIFDPSTAAAMRIQYGGSMKPGNAAGLMKMPDVDGGLIGGASLNAGDFSAIVQAAVRA